MAGQPGDSGLEREAARPAQEAEGECDILGKSPGPSLLMVNWASFRKGTVSYSVCSQIGVIPWSQISG